MSSSSERRRLSDSQLYRDRRTNLLPEPLIQSPSTAEEHKGAFETIGRQLELEEQLHVLCQQLLQSYRETQEWSCVGQLAQALVASSQRVGQLKQRLEALKETSGGLFLERIREQSLPREGGEGAGSSQSLVEIDTTEVVPSAAKGLKLPAEPDTQDSDPSSAQSSDIEECVLEECVLEEPFSSAETDVAAVVVLSSKEHSSQEAGVPSPVVTVQSESHSAVSSSGSSELVDIITIQEGQEEEEEEEFNSLEESDLFFADKEEEKQTADLSTIVASSVVKGESSTKPFSVEDESTSISLQTTADHKQLEDTPSLAVGSESADTTDKDTTPSPPSELTKPAIETTPPPLELTQAIELKNDSVKSSSAEPYIQESSPACAGSFSFPSSGLEGDTLSAVAATGGQASLDTDPQQSVNEGIASSDSFPGETRDDDNLQQTTSVSSIDREFGAVDECLEELTFEIEALVTASEISSETSEQFFSPPESISIEREYENVQLEQEEGEGTEKPADRVCPEDNLTGAEDNGHFSDPVVPAEKETDKPAHLVAIPTEKEDEPVDPVIISKEEVDRPADPVDLGIEKHDSEFAEFEVPLETKEFVEPTKLTDLEKSTEPLDSTEQEAVLQEEKDIHPAEPADPVLHLAQQKEASVEPVDVAEQVIQVEEEEEAVKPVDPAEPEVILQGDKDAVLAEFSDTVVDLEKQVLLKEEEETTKKEKVIEAEKEVLQKKVEEKEQTHHSCEEEASPEISSNTAEEEAKEAGDREDLSPVLMEAERAQFKQEEEEEEVSKSTSTSEGVSGELAAATLSHNQTHRQIEQEEMEPQRAIKYSVVKSSHSMSSCGNKTGSTLYLIDIVTDEHGQRYSPVASQAVMHSLEDFQELHRQLCLLREGSSDNGSCTGAVPLLDLDAVPRENGTCDEEEGAEDGVEINTDQSKILEDFLNQIARDPLLQNEAAVKTFLTPSPLSTANGLLAASETEEATTNGNSSLSHLPLSNGQEEKRETSLVEEDDLVLDDRAVPGEGSPSKEESEEKEVMSRPSLPTEESVGDGDAPANLSNEEAAADEMNSDLVGCAGNEAELSCVKEDLEVEHEADLATRQEEERGIESCVGEGETSDERAALNEDKEREDVATTLDDNDSPLSLSEQASPRKESKASSPDLIGRELSPQSESSCPVQGDSIPTATEKSSEATVLVCEEDLNTEKEGLEEEKLAATEPVEDSPSASSTPSSPTHEEPTPIQKEEEEKERVGPSPSPSHEKASSSTDGEVQPPPTSSSLAGESASALEEDESDFSPTHSERTSSNATTSSYLYTTDESMSPVKAVGKKPPPLPRTSSDPSLPIDDNTTAESSEAYDSFHMSLTPSQPWQPPSEGQSADSRSSGKSKKFKRKGSMPEKIRSSITTVKRSLTTKKQRGQTINLDDESLRSVSPLKPLTTQEWDPTCLLEELYSDYKQGVVTTTNPSGEAARHYGYLDKLPTNRTKANVMTKWKRRYFRAQEGNIYYYQDRTTNRALGFIHLTSARVVPIPEKMQIQIIPKDGKSIMLKAPDVDEFQTWHRALLLEAAHPTLVAPTSPKPAIENPTVIIDIGACSVRAGLVREDAYPEIFFPAVCSFDAESHDVIECGHAALLPDNRIKAQQVYPRRTSLRMDRQRTELNLPLKAMDAIINTIVMQLDIDPQASQLIMTLSPTAPEKERDELIDLLLETFGFAGICLQDQTQLALYSYNTTTGVIVDIGNHITVVPYIDGYAIESGVTRLPYGGNAITECLTKLVTQKGMRYFSETEMFINRFMKESLCYVSQDYEEDNMRCEENPKEFLRPVEVDRFQLPDHRKMITLDSAAFKSTEGLFSPHLWGKDVLGLHEIVWKAIQACPIDQRREVSKKIFLSSGSSVLPGLKERLQKELTSLSPTGVSVEVHCNETSHHAAYCGAAVLASLGSFQNCLVTFEDWSTAGAEALKKWTGS